jgi:hypothetical protein
MQTNWFVILISVVGSASFGAVVGRMLDAFLLARINARQQRERWLREARFKAFSELAAELNSLGFRSEVADNPWRFMGIAASAELLIPDGELVAEIRKFVDDVYALQHLDGSSVKVNGRVVEPGSAEEKAMRQRMKCDDPTVNPMRAIEKGVWIQALEGRAQTIVRRLSSLVAQ